MMNNRYYKSKSQAPTTHDVQWCVISLRIGTHKDAFESDKQMLKVTVSQVRQTVEAKLTPLGYVHALHQKMLVVDARNQEDAKKVCTEIDDMILQDGRFEKQVPLSWILLQGALESSSKMVMSMSDLWPLASECGLNDLEELDAWLGLFQSCMSVIYSDNVTMHSLHNNVIIQPLQFVQCLDRLYYAKFITDLQSKPKLRAHLDLLKKGLLTNTLAEELWLDDQDAISMSKARNTECKFMLDVMLDLGISSKVGLKIEDIDVPLSPTEQIYLVPSLRSDYFHTHPSRESESLIVMASFVHQAPCDVHSGFLNFIQQQKYSKWLQFIPNEKYNVVHLRWTEDHPLLADIFKLLDFEDAAELQVNVSSPTGLNVHPSHLHSLREKLFSIMKTTCIEYFPKLSKVVPAMSYRLGVVSPSCINDPNKDPTVHVLPFDLIGNEKNLCCSTCGRRVNLLPDEPRAVWLKCAYQVYIAIAILYTVYIGPCRGVL